MIDAPTPARCGRFADALTCFNAERIGARGAAIDARQWCELRHPPRVPFAAIALAPNARTRAGTKFDAIANRCGSGDGREREEETRPMTIPVIKGEYGIDTYVPLPDRPEPKRREPVWLDKAGVMKRLRWSEAQFAAAIALPDPLKFPLCAMRTRA